MQTKPLALICVSKTLGALLSGNDQLRFHQLGGLSIQARPPREQFEAPPAQATYLPAARLYDESQGGTERFFVLDRAKRLVYWQSKAKGAALDTNLHLHAGDVLAMAQIHAMQLVYIGAERGSLVAHRLGPSNEKPWHCWLSNTVAVKEVLLGAGMLWRSGFGACALHIGEGAVQQWQVYIPATTPGQHFQILEIALPEAWRAIGLVHLPEQSKFALLALNPARDQLVLCSSQERETIHVSPATIVKFCVCPVNGLVAMMTEARQLTVYDVPTRTLRLTIDGRGGDDAAS